MIKKIFKVVCFLVLFLSTKIWAETFLASVNYSTSTIITVSSSTYTVIEGTRNVVGLIIYNYKSNTDYVMYASEDGGVGPAIEPDNKQVFDWYRGDLYLLAEPGSSGVKVGIFKKFKAPVNRKY